MRLLYVCADRGIPLRGTKGASAHVRQVTAALARRGHDVTLAGRRVGGGNPLPEGVEIETMPADPEEHVAWLDDLVPRRAVQAVLERYSLDSGAAHRVARRHRIPLVLEVNAPLVDEAVRFRGLDGDVDGRRRHERRLLRDADAIVAVSEALAVHARDAGARPSRVAVVPNGVAAAFFARGDRASGRAVAGLPETAEVVGFCGGLRPWHGVDVLLEAMPRLPAGSRLLVVGDGPERDALLRRRDRLGLTDRVVMTGAVPHHEVPDLLAAMDVAAAPYLPMEPFYFCPLKVGEYLAAGLPVVAADVPSLRELAGVVDLVAPGDASALATALGALLRDPRRRRRLAARGRAFAAARTWDGVALRLEALLGEVGAAA